MFPLCCGCGKRSSRKSLIVVRLGHPLRCLVVASCGSNAAKGLRKHFARSAGLPKSTYVGNLRFLPLPIWATSTGALLHGCGATIPHRITPLVHVHERNLKCDLLELKSAECALSKQVWRGSLWHNHLGKSRPKYYPELKLTWFSCLWYPANAVQTRRQKTLQCLWHFTLHFTHPVWVNRPFTGCRAL